MWLLIIREPLFLKQKSIISAGLAFIAVLLSGGWEFLYFPHSFITFIITIIISGILVIRQGSPLVSSASLSSSCRHPTR